jgi:hypothetical protein
MSNANPFDMAVPDFATEGLTEAVEAVRDALAAKPKARDTAAHSHLAALIETLRAIGA